MHDLAHGHYSSFIQTCGFVLELFCFPAPKNSRLFAPGMFFQNGLTGEAWGDWSLYTDSPLRALTPAQECIAGTGGPFPEDFWDPAGITAKKSRLNIC